MLLQLLLIAVAVLAGLVGLIMLTGSYRGTRMVGWSFALACLGAAGWTGSVAWFVGHEDLTTVELGMWGTYIFPVVMLLGLLLSAAFFVRRMVVSRRQRQRQGYAVMLSGLTIWLAACLMFGAMVWIEDYSLIWVGPISVMVALVFCYFATLKYRIFELRQLFAQILSYALVLVIAAMAYMLIFYLVFTALFRVPNPSAEVFVLNFIMIVIVLLLLPIANEFLASARSIIARDSIDLAYIVKRLNRLATAKVDIRNLAGFLADHLHFGYVGFLVDGKVYGSREVKVSVMDWARIIALAEGMDEVWQKVDDGLVESLDAREGVKMIAMLHDGDGKKFGWMLIGGAKGKESLDRRDMLQLETIINLIGIIVESEVRQLHPSEVVESQTNKRRPRRRAKTNSH